MIFLIFIFDFKKINKKIYLIIFILALILSYRILIQEQYLSYKLFFSNLFGDGNSVHFTIYKFTYNFLSPEIITQDIFYTIKEYFMNNISFVSKDMFYMEIFKNTNFFTQITEVEFFDKRNWSIFAPTEVLSHFLVYIFYISIIYFLINQEFFIQNKLVVNVIMIYLLVNSFRGSLIHQMSFVIKFLILIYIIHTIVNFIKKLKKKYEKS